MNLYVLAVAGLLLVVAVVFAFKAGRVGPAVTSKPSRMDSTRSVEVPRNRRYVVGALVATACFLFVGGWVQEDPEARLLGMRMLVLVPCLAVLVFGVFLVGRWLYRRHHRALGRDAEKGQAAEIRAARYRASREQS